MLRVMTLDAPEVQFVEFLRMRSCEIADGSGII